MRQTTLNFLIRGDTILLAMKKRGFGKDKWNGVGGKLQGTETPEESITRETNEEIGVSVNASDLEKVGVINFHFIDKPDWDQTCHIFITKKWTGDPAESEEMRPQWYPFDQIPYPSMWVDDKYWLPLVLAGKKIKAEFSFTNGGATFETWKVEEVASW